MRSTVKILLLPVLLSVLSGVSQDCPILVALAQQMNLPVKHPTIWNSFKNSNQDCCAATGITCRDNKITVINWQNYQLGGNIQDAVFPPDLEVLQISGNSLTGSIPVFPASLERIHLNGNYLTGDISNLPTGLKIIYLAWFGDSIYSPFTGTLNITKPTTISICKTLISDVVVANTSQILVCDLNNTPMLDSPNLNALRAKGCTTSGVYSSNLLPITLSTSKRTLTIGKTTSYLPTKRISISLLATIIETTSPASNGITPTNLDLSSQSTLATFLGIKSLEDGSNYTMFDHFVPSLVYDSLTSLIISSEISPIVSSQATTPSDVDPQLLLETQNFLIYALVGGFIFVCILAVIASFIFKHPKMHSKFGRKNSFGTLNTVNTTRS